MKKLFSSTRFRLAAAALTALILIAGAVLVMLWYYSSHALPGSSVGSVSVAGMTRAQASVAIEDQAAAMKLAVTTEQETTEVSLADAGVTLDVDKTVDEVFAASFFPGIFGVSPTVPAVSIDDKQLEKLVESLPLPEGSEAVESSVSWDKDAQQFVVKKGSSGQAVDAEALGTSLVAAAQGLASTEVRASLIEVEPQVTVKQATEVADTVNRWLTATVSVTDDEGDAEVASVATRAKWIKFSVKSGSLAPSLDTKAVKAWIADFAQYTEVASVTGLRNVNSSGEVVATALPAQTGWEVSNVEDIVKKISASVTSGDSVEAVFTYAETEVKWEDREAAPGAEKLVYQPAVGEKWIDLNLSNATVTAYEGTKVVGGTFYMVPGAPATPTVSGEFNIYLKFEVQDMRGENADGSKYLTKDVPWISYFHNGYAFHGAPWRSSFGWTGEGGSHGCVNMPVADAKFIYEWSEIGTKVVSHY